jgi:glycosyltransferase involved in cell wall biosynthesis
MAESPPFAELSVAVAHWRVRAWGGAEYLVTRLAEAVGVDRVYTLGEPAPDEPNPYGDVRFVDVTDRLDYAPVRRLQHRADRVFEYAQWEDVDWRDLGDPDVLLTSGSTPRAVITPADTLHVNYCHSPPRWFYDLYHDRKGSLAGTLARPVVRYLRTRDTAVDPRVDAYLANSPVIERRLWKYYKREATVVPPPVALAEYRDDGDDGFYLHLGRLDEEKGVPAVVEAFRDLDRRLVLAGGEGDVAERVRRTVETAPNLDYRGFVSDAEKRELLARCRAVVFNGRNEDFGIVPVEANASNKPVLAREEGYPAVFVTDGENGLLHDGSAASIADAVRRFETEGVAGEPRTFAEPFGPERFADAIAEAVTDAYRRVTLD